MSDRQSLTESQQIEGAYTRRRLNSRVVLWFAVGLLIVTLGCGGYLVWFIGSGEFMVRRPCYDGDPDKLSDLARFELPASTSNFHSECVTWQSLIVHVWFDMDSADFDFVVDNTLIDSPLIATDDPPDFGQKQWNASYFYGEFNSVELQTIQEIWIDIRNPEQYHVFISYILD
jgi:hypothetical protein